MSKSKPLLYLLAALMLHVKNLVGGNSITVHPIHPTGFVPTHLCDIANYQINNLTRPSSWTIIADTFCLDTNKRSANCSFTFSFCKPLEVKSGPCDNSAVCQLDLAGGGSVQKEQYRIGTYNDTINPFFDRLDEVEGFMAVFQEGEMANVSDPSGGYLMGNVSIAILLGCNDKVPWIAGDDEQAMVPPEAKPRVIWNVEDLTYWVYLGYSGACLTVNPIMPTISPSSQIIPLSVGSILLIIFFSCIAVYCGVGSAINVCVGKKGGEIIPNSNLWLKLPGYTKDGCQSLCRCQNRPQEGLVKQTGYDSI